MNNSKVSFDDIHTQDKQKNLKLMMEAVNKEVAAIENNNPILESCPICGVPHPSFFVHAYSFDMSICNSCGLIFCNPYPSNAQLMHYYNSEMKAFENRFFRESFEKRVSLFMPRVEIIKKYADGGKLLDIGSAIGVFVESLSRVGFGYEITCCDLSREACEELKVRYPDVDVINDDIQNLSDSESFDVITLWDTIEHIVDLNSLIVKIKRLLSKNGIFVFSTPNTNSFEWRIAGNKHVQILPPGHVNLLNLKSIRALLEKHSIEIVDSFTLNGMLDIGYVKKLIESGDVDTERIGGFIKDELDNPLFVDMLNDYLIKTKQAGNIVVVCREALEIK